MRWWYSFVMQAPNGPVWTFLQSGVTLFRLQYPRDVDLSTGFTPAA